MKFHVSRKDSFAISLASSSRSTLSSRFQSFCVTRAFISKVPHVPTRRGRVGSHVVIVAVLLRVVEELHIVQKMMGPNHMIPVPAAIVVIDMEIYCRASRLVKKSGDVI